MTESSGGRVLNQAVFAGFIAMACMTCVYVFFFG